VLASERRKEEKKGESAVVNVRMSGIDFKIDILLISKASQREKRECVREQESESERERDKIRVKGVKIKNCIVNLIRNGNLNIVCNNIYNEIHRFLSRRFQSSATRANYFHLRTLIAVSDSSAPLKILRQMRPTSTLER
jgi:hypothetical protein